jgi:hypothetical protein
MSWRETCAYFVPSNLDHILVNHGFQRLSPKPERHLRFPKLVPYARRQATALTNTILKDY